MGSDSTIDHSCGVARERSMYLYSTVCIPGHTATRYRWISCRFFRCYWLIELSTARTYYRTCCALLHPLASSPCVCFTQLLNEGFDVQYRISKSYVSINFFVHRPRIDVRLLIIQHHNVGKDGQLLTDRVTDRATVLPTVLPTERPSIPRTCVWLTTSPSAGTRKGQTTGLRSAVPKLLNASKVRLYSPARRFCITSVPWLCLTCVFFSDFSFSFCHFCFLHRRHHPRGAFVCSFVYSFG